MLDKVVFVCGLCWSHRLVIMFNVMHSDLESHDLYSRWFVVAIACNLSDLSYSDLSHDDLSHRDLVTMT